MTATSSSPSPKRRLHRWLGSPRRRVVTAIILVLVASLIALGISDPFASKKGTAGVTDNSYATGKAKVTEQSLSSQTEVSATLGYAGSYTLAVPYGTSAAALSAAQSSATAAEAQVSNQKRALSAAEATSRPTNASTLLAARSTVSNDERGLAQAQAQLTEDQDLGCPASSSTTVTTPLSGGGSSSSTPNDLAATSDASSNTSNVDDTNVRLVDSASSSNEAQPRVSTLASAPSAVTGAVDGVTSTGATLLGSVDPNGADTTYYFEYGTSPNYGSTTPATDLGSGSAVVSLSVALAGLTPGDTYHYRLVATNDDGASYGQDATFQTNAAPSVTTGPATTVSSTAESLSGTIDPNGTATSYYFEYGTSASFGNTSPVSTAGGGQAPESVNATISNLTPGTTYIFALVATSSLGTVVGATSTFQAAASSCVSEHAVIAEDSLALSQAKDSLTLDILGQGSQVQSAEESLQGDEATLASDEQAVSVDEASATNANTTFTELPRLGAVIDRGENVYRLNEQPVPLFYGPVPLYRALYLGVTPGPDVAELNQNLIALRFEGGAGSDDFSASTEAAVEAWQRTLDEPATGVVTLGDVVIEPGPIEVAGVSAMLGDQASAGTAILTATSKTPVVTIALDAADQSEVKVGDRVSITLPNNENTPGVVTSVGTVAVNPSSSSSAPSSGPTITVIVTPTNLRGISHFDQAPVNVAITNATVTNVLTVPIDALLALANGGYAVEEISADGVHHLVAVTVGLFDDDAGLVQVSGSGLAVGQVLVVPSL